MGVLETVIREVGFGAGHLLTYILVAIVMAPLIVWMIKRRHKVNLIEKIPGPRALPILGNALEVNVEPRELFQTILKFSEFGKPIARLWLAHLPYVVITDPSSSEVILSSNKHIDKSRDYVFLHPWLGTGLLTSTGRKWHGRRKMLTPAFHFKILEDFMDVFNKHSETLVKKLGDQVTKGTFNVFPYCTLCTLDIILETAMGLDIDVQNDSESEYVNSLYKLGAILQHRQARPWIHPDILFSLSGYKKEHDRLLKILHDFSYKAIRNRRKEYNEAKRRKDHSDKKEDDIGIKKRLAFLDLLLQYTDTAEGKGLTDVDIREEVDTFMFEGHDTTAAAINWTLYLLGTHPEIQSRVHKEIDDVFGGDDRPVTSADLRELKYLENCIKESLRLFPSVPFLGRELKEETVINGYTVPEGTTALIITYKLHRDPEQFPNPEKFDPDRFTVENSAKRHPYAYVPFSAGPRNCIGQKFALMEEKVVLCHVLRKYRIESEVRREDLKILGELILRPEDGNYIKVHKRQ